MEGSTIEVTSSVTALEVEKKTALEVEKKTALEVQKKTVRKNFNWNDGQDDILIDALYSEIMEGGKRSNNGYKTDTLKHVSDKISSLIVDVVITVSKVKNRLKTLKANYLLWKEASRQSGFSMTEDGRILADDLVWEPYIAAHPKASALRTTKIRHFDKLVIIFGNDHANGDCCVEGNDPTITIDVDAISGDNQNPIHVEMEQGEASNSTAARKFTPTKRRRHIPGLEKYDQSMLVMADAAKEVAKAFKKAPPLLSRCYMALKELPGLTQEERVNALELMGKEPMNAEIFEALDEHAQMSFVLKIIARQ